MIGLFQNRLSCIDLKYHSRLALEHGLDLRVALGRVALMQVEHLLDEGDEAVAWALTR